MMALLGILACAFGAVMLKVSLDTDFFGRVAAAWAIGPLRAVRRMPRESRRRLIKAARAFYLVLGSAFVLGGCLLIVASVAMALT
jgi:hypothetical protein